MSHSRSLIAHSSSNSSNLLHADISLVEAESHPTTKTVQFDLYLNQDIDRSPINVKQTESIRSTLVNYPLGRKVFDEESDGNNCHYTQQSESNIFSALSPKRQHSISSVSELSKATSALSTQVKTLSSPKKRKLSKHAVHTTKIGSIPLPWPQFKIVDTIYMSKKYTVTNTCSLDSALFIFYHSYKTGGSTFQQLFEMNTTHYHTSLRKLFKLVESDGWNIARLHWLVSNNLLNEMNFDDEFDVRDTLFENVLQFVRPMQMYNIKSECSCMMCPKRIRENKSIDISLQ
jgi:hypothetical protein